MRLRRPVTVNLKWNEAPIRDKPYTISVCVCKHKLYVCGCVNIDCVFLTQKHRLYVFNTDCNYRRLLRKMTYEANYRRLTNYRRLLR